MIEPSLLQILRDVQTDETDHLAGTLLDHLVGTHDVLEGWGLSRDVCNAGLFHSVYGTQLFDVQSVTYDQRANVRNAIGTYAERLAYLFSVIDRNMLFPQIDQPKPRVYDRVRHQIEMLTAAELRDLIEIEIANFVEFSPRFSLRPTSVDVWSARFETARNLASPATMRATRRAFDEQRARVAA